MTTRQIELELLTLPPLDRFRLAQMLLGSLDVGQLVNGVDERKVDEMLTVGEAADILNVSEPYITTLIEQNDIRHKHTNGQLHINAIDFFAYQRKSDKERRAMARELTEQAQALGMGY